MSAAAGAQQVRTVSQRGGYDLSRETSVLGTVVSFTPQSKSAPAGGHLVLQTSSGTIDVNLGNTALLKTAGVELKTGDSLRILGENVNFMGGQFFAARVVQKGTQAVKLRSSYGISLAAPRQRNASASDSEMQGGAR